LKARIETREVGVTIKLSFIRFACADGVIGAVGIPVFKGQMDDLYGVWMQDASPKSETMAGKLWVTRSTDTSHIYEYADVDDYSQRKILRNIKLPYPFQVCTAGISL
jgi:hypothetical protein